MVKKIKTWLPIFPGFYETIYNYDEDAEADWVSEQLNIEREEAIDWLCDHVDYRRYEEDVAKLVTDFIFREAIHHVPDDHQQAIDDLFPYTGTMEDFFPEYKFLKIDSPQYYNYRNDSIDVTVSVNMDLLWTKIIYPWYERIKVFVENDFKYSPGYLPPASNNFDEWIVETKNFTENLDGIYMHWFIHYILIEIMNINPYDMYGFVFDSISLSDYYEIKRK